jgi:hypothetical protein
MNHMEILKRAWHIVKEFRALWIFGIILALTTSSSNFQMPSSNNSSSSQSETDTTFDQNGDFQQQMDEAVKEFEAMVDENQVPEAIQTAIGIGIALACLLLLLFIASRVLRWIAEVALIRMVDQYEETGEKVTWRAGFKLGWSNATWRVFLLNLLMFFLPILAFFLLVGVTVVPLSFASYAAWESGQTGAGIATSVGAVGLSFLYIFLLFVYIVLAYLVVRLARRVIVLEDKQVIESVREAITLIRENFKDVGIMWLIMVGVAIGYPVVVAPIAFLLLAVGIVIGGLFFLPTWGITGLFSTDVIAIIAGSAIGGLILLLIVALPLLFLGGLRQVFTSSSWTLTFRELRALAALELVLPDGDAV